MGKIEQRVAKRKRRTSIQRAVLETVLVSGVVSMAVLAPNALQALTMFDQGKRRKQDPKYAINRAIRRLVDQGSIRFEDTPHGRVARITDRGKRDLLRLGSSLPLETPKRWDGKWRMLAFDIGEYRRRTRDLLRRMLAAIGFVQLQRSVWVYPYPCEDVVALLKADLKIGKDVLYVVVEELEADASLRKRFDLPHR